MVEVLKRPNVKTSKVSKIEQAVELTEFQSGICCDIIFIILNLHFAV